MIRPKISVYHHPNTQIRSFLLDTEVSAYCVERFEKPLTANSEGILNDLGVIGATIVKDILTIDGVKEIHIKPKEIRLKKEISSSWNGIEKRVIDILIRAIRKKELKIIKKNSH